MAHAPRNHQLFPGVWRYSRSKMYGRSALYKRNKPKNPAVKVVKPAAPETKEVKVRGAANGGTRIIALNKAPRWYPAEDVRRMLPSRKRSPRPTRLRASIKPGSVVILIAGRFRGKRVVVLKQLPKSGLLLVTGPFKINGVPLRRVNQAYVIATSTQVDLAGVDATKFDDTYFKKAKLSKDKKTAEAFFSEGADKKPKQLPEHKVADQKAVDGPLLKTLAKDNMLRTYLASSFSLSKGQFPHLMKF